VAGHHSLRYALLTAAVFNLWSFVHFLLAARTLRADIAATEQGARADPERDGQVPIARTHISTARP
jgi:hypothetical protein